MLDLKQNNLGSEGAEHLARNTTWIKLEILLLSHNNITDKGIVQLGCNASWRRLKELDLGDNFITDEGINGFIKNSPFKELTTLYLNNNLLGDDVFNIIGNKGAENIYKNAAWKHLKVWILSYNQIINAGASKIIRNNSCNELEELHLSATKIGNETTNWVGCNIPWRKLKKLDLSQNHLTDKGAQNLMKNSLGLTFQLDLSQNNLSDETLAKTTDSKLWMQDDLDNLNHIPLWRDFITPGEEKNHVGEKSDIESEKKLLSCEETTISLQANFQSRNGIVDNFPKKVGYFFANNPNTDTSLFAGKNFSYNFRSPRRKGRSNEHLCSYYDYLANSEFCFNKVDGIDMPMLGESTAKGEELFETNYHHTKDTRMMLQRASRGTNPQLLEQQTSQLTNSAVYLQTIEEDFSNNTKNRELPGLEDPDLEESTELCGCYTTSISDQCFSEFSADIKVELTGIQEQRAELLPEMLDEDDSHTSEDEILIRIGEDIAFKHFKYASSDERFELKSSESEIFQKTYHQKRHFNLRGSYSTQVLKAKERSDIKHANNSAGNVIPSNYLLSSKCEFLIAILEGIFFLNKDYQSDLINEGTDASQVKKVEKPCRLEAKFDKAILKLRHRSKRSHQDMPIQARKTKRSYRGHDFVHSFLSEDSNLLLKQVTHSLQNTLSRADCPKQIETNIESQFRNAINSLTCDFIVVRFLYLNKYFLTVLFTNRNYRIAAYNRFEFRNSQQNGTILNNWTGLNQACIIHKITSNNRFETFTTIQDYEQDTRLSLSKNKVENHPRLMKNIFSHTLYPRKTYANSKLYSIVLQPYKTAFSLEANYLHSRYLTLDNWMSPWDNHIWNNGNLIGLEFIRNFQIILTEVLRGDDFSAQLIYFNTGIQNSSSRILCIEAVIKKESLPQDSFKNPSGLIMLQENSALVVEPTLKSLLDFQKMLTIDPQLRPLDEVRLLFEHEEPTSNLNLISTRRKNIVTLQPTCQTNERISKYIPSTLNQKQVDRQKNLFTNHQKLLEGLSLGTDFSKSSKATDLADFDHHSVKTKVKIIQRSQRPDLKGMKAIQNLVCLDQQDAYKFGLKLPWGTVLWTWFVGLYQFTISPVGKGRVLRSNIYFWVHHHYSCIRTSSNHSQRSRINNYQYYDLKSKHASGIEVSAYDALIVSSSKRDGFGVIEGAIQKRILIISPKCKRNFNLLMVFQTFYLFNELEDGLTSITFISVEFLLMIFYSEHPYLQIYKTDAFVRLKRKDLDNLIDCCSWHVILKFKLQSMHVPQKSRESCYSGEKFDLVRRKWIKRPLLNLNVMVIEVEEDYTSGRNSKDFLELKIVPRFYYIFLHPNGIMKKLRKIKKFIKQQITQQFLVSDLRNFMVHAMLRKSHPIIKINRALKEDAEYYKCRYPIPKEGKEELISWLESYKPIMKESHAEGLPIPTIIVCYSHLGSKPSGDSSSISQNTTNFGTNGEESKEEEGKESGEQPADHKNVLPNQSMSLGMCHESQNGENSERFEYPQFSADEDTIHKRSPEENSLGNHNRPQFEAGSTIQSNLSLSPRSFNPNIRLDDDPPFHSVYLVNLTRDSPSFPPQESNQNIEVTDFHLTDFEASLTQADILVIIDRGIWIDRTNPDQFENEFQLLQLEHALSTTVHNNWTQRANESIDRLITENFEVQAQICGEIEESKENDRQIDRETTRVEHAYPIIPPLDERPMTDQNSVLQRNSVQSRPAQSSNNPTENNGFQYAVDLSQDNHHAESGAYNPQHPEGPHYDYFTQSSFCDNNDLEEDRIMNIAPVRTNVPIQNTSATESYELDEYRLVQDSFSTRIEVQEIIPNIINAYNTDHDGDDDAPNELTALRTNPIQIEDPRIVVAQEQLEESEDINKLRLNAKCGLFRPKEFDNYLPEASIYKDWAIVNDQTEDQWDQTAILQIQSSQNILSDFQNIEEIFGYQLVDNSLGQLILVDILSRSQIEIYSLVVDDPTIVQEVGQACETVVLFGSILEEYPSFQHFSVISEVIIEIEEDDEIEENDGMEDDSNDDSDEYSIDFDSIFNSSYDESEEDNF